MQLASTGVSEIQEVLKRKEAELARVLRERGGIASGVTQNRPVRVT